MVLTDNVVGPWVDVVTSVPVVVVLGGSFGVVLELTVVVPVGCVPVFVVVPGLVHPMGTEVVPVKTIAVELIDVVSTDEGVDSVSSVEMAVDL